MPRLVIDYDTYAYSVGFASETRSIVATHKNSKDSWTFANRTEFYGRDRKGGWLEEMNLLRDSPWLPEEFEIQDIQEAKPLSLAREILNYKIRSVVKHLHAKEWYGYLGKEKSFRHDVATILEYKGGKRKENLKPLLLPQITEMILQEHNGKVATHRLEADDWLSIDSYEAWKDWSKTKSDRHRLIAITEDKDHLQCTGHFFNPDKMVLPESVQGFGKLFWRDDTAKPTLSGRGRLWLIAQCCKGDSVDNIAPSYLAQNARFGDTACYKLLAHCRDDKEALTALVTQYKAWYPSPVEYVSWRGEKMTKNWLEIAGEMWQLARMKRWVGDDIPLQEVLNAVGVPY